MCKKSKKAKEAKTGEAKTGEAKTGEAKTEKPATKEAKVAPAARFLENKDVVKLYRLLAEEKAPATKDASKAG